MMKFEQFGRLLSLDSTFALSKLHEMPFIKCNIHLIWFTKNRKPMITKQLKNSLLNHIREVSLLKNIHIVELNCVEDHIHLIVSLKPTQDIAKTVMLIKGESSYWVNKQKLLTEKFEWQDDYLAFSVSESQLQRVINYIRNQEEHHRKKMFQEEYEEFLIAMGLKQT